MGSQTDLDQGGTSRQWTLSYLGPSVGWIRVPLQNVLPITAAGTYLLDPSVSLVTVNVAGAVTITLPAATDPSVSAIALPGLYANNPITIVDIGGFALANPITIHAAAGENIMSLPSITISTNFGGWTLLPNSTLHGWSAISP